jgi:phage gp36-like protein
MADYATEADITDRYGADALRIASDRDHDRISDPSPVSRALTDATAVINSYIGKVYDLPLASVPDVLVAYCVDIAFYKLHSTHDVLTDEIKDRYNQAMQWLRDVASQKATLGLDTPADTLGGGASMSAGTRIFTRTTMQDL